MNFLERQLANGATLNTLKDNVFTTLDLPRQSECLTRQLLPKEFVKHSFVDAILQKNSDQALFYAYEFYESGFRAEFMHTIWELYETHFAEHYPDYRQYLTELGAPTSTSVAELVYNFIIRTTPRSPTSVELYSEFDQEEIEQYLEPSLPISFLYNDSQLCLATFSPYWSHLLQEYRGWPDYTKQTIGFVNDDCRQQFWDMVSELMVVQADGQIN